MFIFGWGSDKVTKALNDWTVAVCHYRYVHIFWVFSVVTNRKWFIQGRDRAQDMEVTREQLEDMYGSEAVPDSTFWRKWSLVALPGAFVGLSVAAAIVGGLTSLLGSEPDGDVAQAEPVAAVALEGQDGVAGHEESNGDEIVSDSIGQVVDGAGSDVESAVELSEADDEDSLSPSPGDASLTDEESLSSRSGSVVGVATRIEQTSDDNLVSLDLTSVKDEYGELVVDHAYSVSELAYSASVGSSRQSGDVIAAPGNKLVVVDIQIRVREFGNLFDTAVRLVDPATGSLYSTSTRINLGVSAGSIVNAPLLFEVPADLMVMELQGGALDGDRDGYQAVFAIQMEASSVPTGLPVDVAFNEGPVSASLSSDDNVGEARLDRLGGNVVSLATIDVVGGEVLGKIEASSAAVGHKWVVLDLQMVGQGPAVVLNEASLRLIVDGEWYPSVTRINTGISRGGLWSGPVVFEIPADAETAILGFGTPAGWGDDGHLAEYRLTLP